MAAFGFQRVSGDDRGFQTYTIASITVAIGDLLAFDRAAETVILATSSSTPESLAGVAVEARTTADTTVLVQRITVDDEYIASSANNSDTAHNYHRMLLTDEDEVNNTASDDTTDAAVFMQLATVGAAADKKIRGRFVTVQDRAA